MSAYLERPLNLLWFYLHGLRAWLYSFHRRESRLGCWGSIQKLYTRWIQIFFERWLRRHTLYLAQLQRTSYTLSCTPFVDHTTWSPRSWHAQRSTNKPSSPFFLDEHIDPLQPKLWPRWATLTIWRLPVLKRYSQLSSKIQLRSNNQRSRKLKMRNQKMKGNGSLNKNLLSSRDWKLQPNILILFCRLESKTPKGRRKLVCLNSHSSN